MPHVVGVSRGMWATFCGIPEARCRQYVCFLGSCLCGYRKLADPGKHSTTRRKNLKRCRPPHLLQQAEVQHHDTSCLNNRARKHPRRNQHYSTVSRPQVTSGASLKSLVQGAVQCTKDGIFLAIDNHISIALQQLSLTQPMQPIQQPTATSQPQGPMSISTQLGQNATGEPT